MNKCDKYLLTTPCVHRWVLISLDKSEEEEVVVSPNPRVPHLSGKKWEAATHKVNVVHEVRKYLK